MKNKMKREGLSQPDIEGMDDEQQSVKRSVRNECLMSRQENLKIAIDKIKGRVATVNIQGASIWSSAMIREDILNDGDDDKPFNLTEYVMYFRNQDNLETTLSTVLKTGYFEKCVMVDIKGSPRSFLMIMTYDKNAECNEITVSFTDSIDYELDEDQIESLVLPLSKLQEDIAKFTPRILSIENVHLAILTIRNISDISFIRGEKHVDKIFESYTKLIRPKFSSKVKFYRVSEFELGLLIETTLDAQEVLLRLKHFVNLVETNIAVDGYAYHIKIHGGVSTLSPNQSIDSLIRNASFAKDIAANENKAIEAYSLDDIAKHIEDITMAERFENALYNNELNMEYQPIVSRDKKIWGYESLIRWRDKQYGVISPLKIIEYAERSGTMIRLGYWIVRRVFEDVSKIQKETDCKNIVSINLSLEQFQDPLLAETLYDLSKEYSVDPKYVMFEITESHAFSNLELIRNVLIQLNNYGFNIALDDFGVGYSTIMNLVDLPITILKLDKSLIRNMKTNQRSVVVCESIVSLANKLGLTIIAEGIESLSDESMILEFDVNLIQGFYYHRPMICDRLIATILESICQVA